MSKSLKKLIDINRLREFKNKLVGTGSAYVQTTAVDQTIAGTKTFSKPIVGSVTGSSGSCTGNAATATTAANGVDSAGGDWIRFKNGIQICTGTTPSIYLVPGEFKAVSINFPKSFSAVPNVIACSASPHVIASTWKISMTGCEVFLKSTSTGDIENIGKYIAFGTWK